MKRFNRYVFKRNFNLLHVGIITMIFRNAEVLNLTTVVAVIAAFIAMDVCEFYARKLGIL